MKIYNSGGNDAPYSIGSDGGDNVYLTAASYGNDSVYVTLDYSQYTKNNTLWSKFSTSTYPCGKFSTYPNVINSIKSI